MDNRDLVVSESLEGMAVAHRDINYVNFDPEIYRVCTPIIFERYGREAARDRAYVDACYYQVPSQMQQELDS